MSFQVRKQSLVSTDVKSSVGTVAGVLLPALSPGRSGGSDSDLLRAGTRDLAIGCTTDSVGHVYLPWFRVMYTHSGCTYISVGFGHEQRGHFGSVCILHLQRLSGVGRQLVPTLSKKLIAQLVSQIVLSIGFAVCL